MRWKTGLDSRCSRGRADVSCSRPMVRCWLKNSDNRSTKCRAPANMCAGRKTSSSSRSRRRRRWPCTGCCRGFWNSERKPRYHGVDGDPADRPEPGPVFNRPHHHQRRLVADRHTAACNRIPVRRAADGDFIAVAFGPASGQTAGRRNASSPDHGGDAPRSMGSVARFCRGRSSHQEGGHRFDHLFVAMHAVATDWDRSSRRKICSKRALRNRNWWRRYRT